MIQLFDVYNQETQDLHDSLLAAGISCPTIILEPNGFLPDGMICPYTYFLGEREKTDKPLFFNQVPVPPYWEIAGDNQSARILDKGEEKARIHYHGQSARLVKQVDWLDRQGRLRIAEHYDKYGRRFARTLYKRNQEPITTTYFSEQDEERLVENHATGSLILTLEQEPTRIFKNKLDFIRFFLDYLGLDLDHILFNSLSYSFLVSHSLTGRSGQDILFWQEPLYDAIPGNMQLILTEDQLRAQTIVIPDRETYERALSLIDPAYHHKLLTLGYHYLFKRDNFLRADALILTHSDQIEHLETLVAAMPQLVFRIAALTEMSPKLLSLLSYPNVILYQNASPKQIDQLFQQSDIYLDINYGGQVLQAVRTAFEHNLLIAGFEETVHDRRYIARQHLFGKDQVDQLKLCLEQALAHVEGMRGALLAQGRHANDLPIEQYGQQLKTRLGGLDD